MTPWDSFLNGTDLLWLICLIRAIHWMIQVIPLFSWLTNTWVRERLSPRGEKLTRVASEGSGWDDRLVLAEISALADVVFKRAFGFVAMQGCGIVLWVKAVVGGDTLQTVEWRLTAPWLRQTVTAIEALSALEWVLASQFTWETYREKKYIHLLAYT